MRFDERDRLGRRMPFVKSVRFALDGIAASALQRNFRIQFAIAVMVIAAAAAIGVSRLEWLALAIAIGLVISLEMVNTSIEAIVDLVSPDEHPLARVAKDTAAGAVLVAVAVAIVIGGIVFIPALISSTWP